MPLKDWFPKDSEREAYFGLDRGMSQLPNGMWLIADIHVSDSTRRTWTERLFSRPWAPLQTHAATPRAYLVDDTILVSYESYRKIKQGLMAIPHVVSKD